MERKGNSEKGWMNIRLPLFLLSITVFLGLTACTKTEKDELLPVTAYEELSGDRSLGQTFVAQHDGLDTISVYLAPSFRGNGKITLHLRSSQSGTNDLQSAFIQLNGDFVPGYYDFHFSPIVSAKLEYFYFELEVTGEETYRVAVAPVNSYLNGTFFSNGSPLDLQSVFLLSYQPWAALQGLFSETIRFLLRFSIGLLLFLLPGWVLADSLIPSWRTSHWLERACIGICLSLALYPIIILWSYTIGLNLGLLYAWLPAAIALGYLLWKNHQALLNLPATIRSIRFQPTTVDVALVVSISLIIFTRFWAIRTIEVPMWGDSYQHSLIAQLIVENGGLFSSWQPYSDLISFTYHFGFHSLVSVFHWMTRMPVHESVLWFGQFLNVFAVVNLFPLALKMNSNPWSGVGAIIFAGLFSMMPMFYLNWGRYTQLTGLVLLPGLVWATWHLIEQSRIYWRLVVMSAILFAGLGLTHYRITIFAIGWFAILLLTSIIDKRVKFAFTNFFLILIGTGAAISPWLANLSGSRLAGWFSILFRRSITSPPLLQTSSNPFVDFPFLVFVVLAFLFSWSAWRRNKNILLIGFWWLLLYLFSNTIKLGLPITGLDNFTLQISGYFLASLILGETAGWLADAFARGAWDLSEKFHPSTKYFPFLFRGALVVLVAGTACWGVSQRIRDIQPSKHALVTSPDLRAFEWIKQNTTEADRFLVNSFFAFNNSAVVGSDAGWWMPLLAGRETNLPPLNYLIEEGTSNNYSESVNALVEDIESNGLNSVHVIDSLRKHGITYLYSGQLQGMVNSPKPLILPEQLLGSPYYKLVYNEDRIWIFMLQGE